MHARSRTPFRVRRARRRVPHRRDRSHLRLSKRMAYYESQPSRARPDESVARYVTMLRSTTTKPRDYEHDVVEGAEMEALRYLTDAERVRLLARAESRSFSANEVILAEDRYNEDIYILIGGCARVE